MVRDGRLQEQGRGLRRLSNTLFSQPGERERSGRVFSHPWICFISPASTQEKMLGRKHIYTNCSAALLFPCRPLCRRSCKEGGTEPHFAMELDPPRIVQGTSLRCFGTLGCSVLILVTSCLFSQLLPYAVSTSALSW